MAQPEPSLVRCDLNVADYPEIIALWQRAGLHIRPEGRDAPAAFARQMALGVQRVVGLRAGSRLVAVAVLTHDGRKGWINRLAVDPGYRRQGLAALLLEEAGRWFTGELGLEIWAALVEADNPASLSLFQSAGFERGDVVYLSKRSRRDA